MGKDLSEMQFGRLTAKEIVGKGTRSQGNLWRCECSCGGEKIVPERYLLNQHTRSCGCINREIKENAVKKGDRWGRLEADHFVRYDTPENGHRAIWLFKCDCGNLKEMPVSNVKFGNVRSCGCKATEHITGLRRQDITGETFDRLTALRPTNERDKSGGVIWEFQCECGNITKMSVNTFRSGRVHSCGCLYKESRSACTTYRRDLIEQTSLSSIVSTKKRPSDPTKHPGVYFDKRSKKWQATYRKKRYYLGSSTSQQEAIEKRQEAERMIHDPVVIDNVGNLTETSRDTFIRYLNKIDNKK